MRQLLCLAVISLASCFTDVGSRSCTEIGCSDQLIMLVRPAGSFTPGDYEIDATLDGIANLCTFTIDSTGALANQQCEVTLFVGGDLQIAYPAAETIDFAIRLDGIELHSDQVTPAYAFVAPNGEDCPPKCEQAQIDVQL